MHGWSITRHRWPGNLPFPGWPLGEIIMGKFEKAAMFGGAVLLTLLVYKMVFKSFLPTGIQTLIGL